MNTIAMVIATRGNSQKLARTISENLKTAILPSTTIVVGLDEDDPGLDDTLRLVASFGGTNVNVVVGPRPDSIGGVYNRCAEQTPADIFIAGADDLIIKTQAWDTRILKEIRKLPDGIGAIGCGDMPVASTLPGTYAVTRPLIDRMGFFLQPYTPYWWMDTWLFEIAFMIGRLLPLKLAIDFGENWAHTRGMRDLTYWAAFFDDMRPRRRALAEQILRDPAFIATDEQKARHLERLDRLCEQFRQSNSCLRDPAYAAKITETFAHNAPEDERYLRIKARSERLLQQNRP